MIIESYLSNQLAALCRDHPVARKVLVAPSQQAGYNLTGWLLRDGHAWGNLAVETLQSLARRLAGPTLESEGLRSLSMDEALFLVRDVVSDVIAHLPGDETSALTAGPGLAEAARATIQTLRLGGVEPAELSADAGRSLFLKRTYEGFVERLERARLYDAAILYRRAAEAVPKSRALMQSVVAVMDEVKLPAVALPFVEVCRQASVAFVRVGRPDFQVDPPSTSAATRLSSVKLAAPSVFDNQSPPVVHPAGQIRVSGLQPDHGELVTVRDAVGVEAEVRGVFREIVNSEIPLDSIEIVYTTADPYVPLLVTVGELLGISITYGEGFPAHLTRPGQAITGFYRWLARGLESTELVHLLRSGLVSLPTANGGATALANVLKRQRARRGADEHRAAVRRERATITADRPFAPKPDWLRRQLERVDRIEAALEELLRLVPDGSASVGDVVEAGLSFLGRFFSPGGERDHRALESVSDRLEALRGEVIRGSVAGLSDVLLSMLSTHRVEISAAREGHLHVVPVSRAGYAGRSAAFVIGLDEASFPGGAVEDPLLPDHERRRLSGSLEDALGRPNERVWDMLRYLGTVPGCVTLVANRFELIDGRERYASSIFAQCREDLRIEAPVRYAPSFPLEKALTETEGWVAQRSSAEFGRFVAARYQPLAASAEATDRRSSPEITRFDGYLGRKTPEASLAAGATLSASKLERLAACPHHYFLADVLGVTPLDEPDDDDHRWLDHRRFGSLVHEVLFAFMTAMRERGARPRAAHREELHALAESTALKLCEAWPPETDLAFRADVRRLKRTMDLFLAADERSSYREALEFERRFGYGDNSPRYPSPVELRLGDDVTLRLRGSIDRVDAYADGFVIWDYKTGSSRPFSRRNLFEGEKLQWALYALAYRALIDGLPTEMDVIRSGYFFVGERESGRRIAQAVPAPADVAQRLRPLLRMAESGLFPHYQRLDKNSSPCRFCDFKALCAGERRTRDDLPTAAAAGIPEELHDILVEWLAL